jgi:hypothetical protein
MKAQPRIVHLTGIRENSTLTAARKLAAHCAPKNFEISLSRKEADIFLYLEYGYVGLAELPVLLRQIRSAPRALHFLFSEADWPYPILPGAYPSLGKHFPWANSWCYLPRYDPRRTLPLISEPAFLFSFLGRVSTHPVREQLIHLDSAASPCVDSDRASEQWPDYNYATSYQRLIADSKFILCPRGYGASSIRIFEVMAAQRVPVIISDEFRRPPNIPWDLFAVFVPERNVSEIPRILQDLEHRWRDMGHLAKTWFDKCFAPDVFFDALLASLVKNYSRSSFSSGSTLLRACSALGTREIRSILSAPKNRLMRRLRKTY